MKIFAILFFLMLMMTETIFAQTPPPVEPGVSQALAKWRAVHYSDVRYKLNITLEKQAPLMRGEIEIRVKLTEEGAKNDLILDWRTTQFANDKDKPFANLVAVNDATGAQPTGAQAARLPEREARTKTPQYQLTSNDTEASWRTLRVRASEPLALQSNEHLIIPSKYLKTGENVIKIEFASPIKTSGAAITRYVDKEDGAEYVYSLFVPSDASTAFPVFDQPDLKARFTLSLGVENVWRAVSNTKIVSRTNLDCRKGNFCGTIHNFEETKPISTYVFAFAAGEFVKVSEPPAVAGGSTTQQETSAVKENETRNPPATAGGSDIYVRKSQAEKFKAHSKEVFRLNREGIKFLESYFDYKFPFPKYDLVLIPEFPFGGMEHAGATFLREASIIFPSEPTKNDFISRANLIFHEAAHQWFGDTVTMKWFDDLWLKEGFAEFMAYKTLEKVMPEYNAWKAFYERNKPLAYLTDSTKGTTPIYQEIPNLSAAKSAYGNIVYRKAPAFLKQAEFYLGEKEFQTAVRAFLKKHEFANAEWTDLVKEFETASKQDLREWANVWVKQRGMPIITFDGKSFLQKSSLGDNAVWQQKILIQTRRKSKTKIFEDYYEIDPLILLQQSQPFQSGKIELFDAAFILPNYGDYGYGIFLLDAKSRDYVLKNIQTEKDDFLRSMMWGTLWDSVREAELDPKLYVELAIKNINIEQDESTIQAILSRVGTALNYYIEPASSLSVPSALADGSSRTQSSTLRRKNPPATAGGTDLVARLEAVLTERIANAKTPGQRITFYRAYLNLASSAAAQKNLKDILAGRSKLAVFQLRTKDKFDIVTRLLILGDKDAPNLLANLEKAETSDDAKRYAYAARAGIGTTESKAKYFRDFMTDKNISESWIEAAFVPFNSARHSDLTLPYLETALAELPNLKRTRKIFFVNGWLGAFIGGQKSEAALATVNKFLADNPNLDKDLRLKILENSDNLERAVKIRGKYGK